MEDQRYVPTLTLEVDQDPAIVEVLNELLTVVHDSLNGYRTGEDALEDGNYAALFNEYAQQREQMGIELSNLVVKYGGTPQHNGSVAGALHRVWVNIKAAANQGDESIMAESDLSEEATLKTYQNALALRDLPEELRDVIRNHMSLVRLAHERIQALKAVM